MRVLKDCFLFSVLHVSLILNSVGCYVLFKGETKTNFVIVLRF